MAKICVALFVLVTILKVAVAAPVENAIRELFVSYDKDDNGSLGPEELRGLLKELGLEVSDQDIEKDFGKEPVNFEAFNEGLDQPKYQSAITKYTLRKLFNRHDTAKVGALGKQQLIDVMKELGFVQTEKDIENLFGKEPVKIEQFVDVLQSPEFLSIEEAATDKELRDLFKTYDTDQDGEISKEEFKKAMKSLGVTDISDEDYKINFGDKPVTFEVFKNFLDNSNYEVDQTRVEENWVKILEKLFNDHKQEHSETIDTKGIQRLMAVLGSPVSEEEVVLSFGKNPVSLEKFKEVMEGATAEAQATMRMDASLKNMFDGHDLGHKGHLSVDELKNLLNAMALRMSKEDIIKEFGTDGATFEEFKKFVSVENPFLVKTEEEVNAILRPNCEAISQGKEKFTKQDVLHYYNDILKFTNEDIFEGLDKHFKEAEEKNGGLWTIEDCMTHMRKSFNIKMIKEGQDVGKSGPVNRMQKYYFRE